MSGLNPVALQLYSLREALAVDFEGMVRQVADMGYVGVEPYGGMPGGLENSAALFRELGLEVLNSHVPFPDGQDAEAVLGDRRSLWLEARLHRLLAAQRI